ncbi:unnamed protein product [Cunninghamella blakesleeana]
MSFESQDIDYHQQRLSIDGSEYWKAPHHTPNTGFALPTEWTFGSRTLAERMTKDERDFAQLPRVAAYCTGEGYQLARLRSFLREHHHVSSRQYDEALYAAYHFPLMTLRPDKDNLFNIRVRSASPRPPIRRYSTHDYNHINNENQNINNNDIIHHDHHHQHHHSDPQYYDHVNISSSVEPGQANLDEVEMNYDEDHYEQENISKVDFNHLRPGHPFPQNDQHQSTIASATEYDNIINDNNNSNSNNDDINSNDDDNHINEQQHQNEEEQEERTVINNNEGIGENYNESKYQHDVDAYDHDHHHEQQEQIQHHVEGIDEGTKVIIRKPFEGGEVFIFDYGVVVFWNFSRAEELLMLEDLQQFSIRPFRDNPDEDLQIEEMHFQYDTSQLKPRIFNDMITMKTGNHMIKLTLSHGLSQSAVLARYEDIMDKTIEDTKHLPKEMAKTGRLGKTRTEITKINGQLFNLRMNVNLVSNVLDTPEIFWSEPALQPMYNAIREYLEISQRVKILNDRLRVISDLLSMLRDHLTNFGVEYQTLIIIYLIIIAVIVACFEIAVKILQSLKV